MAAGAAGRYPGPMRLIAYYPSREALATDVRDQLGKGGLLVKLATVPAGFEMYATVELEIACEAATVVVPALVLQVFAGVGVAVSVDAAGRARIESLATEPTAPTPPVTTRGTDPASGTATAARPAVSKLGASTVEKIQMALRGDRDDRFAVLRDPNRMLHVHVLRNPSVQLDEISAMARMTTISVEVLKEIAERREWGHRPEIAIALIRNPTVPPGVAIGLLDHVHPVELRQLAKDTRTRAPIQKAARRKVLD